MSWPNNIYTLGAFGIVIASMTIMIKDILDTVPTDTYSSSTNLTDSIYATNSRQNELDNLVNNLPVTTNTNPVSNGVTENTTTTTTPVTIVSPTTPTVTNPTPVPIAPIVPVKPVPVCTTSKSGITTCI